MNNQYVEGIDGVWNQTEYLREQTEYLRVMEVQYEGLVRKRNNEIRKKRWGALTWIQPGDVICKLNDIVDVRKMQGPLLTDLTMDFVIYRPEHRLPKIGGETDVPFPAAGSVIGMSLATPAMR